MVRLKRFQELCSSYKSDGVHLYVTYHIFYFLEVDMKGIAVIGNVSFKWEDSFVHPDNSASRHIYFLLFLSFVIVFICHVLNRGWA